MKRSLVALSMAFPALAFAGSLQAPKLAGQDQAVARVENTVAAWRGTNSVVWGTAIRSVERRLLREYQDHSIQHLPVLSTFGGEVIYPLGHIFPVLQTAPIAFSTIVLGKGVRPVSAVGAPASEWVVKTTYAAGHPIMEIMPIFAGLDANLQIVAESPHGHLLTYSIGLASDARQYTPILSFYRQHIHVRPTVQQVARLAAQDALNPIANAAHVSTNWRVQCVTGDCVKPISVASSATATFIKLPTDDKPMILVRHKNGASSFVHDQMDGDTLVVGAVPYRIDLMTGTGNDISLLRITRGN